MSGVVRLLPLLLAVVAVVVSTACARGDGVIDLTSPAFDDGATIPLRHACEGDNESPPLEWTDVSDDAVELALVMADLEGPEGIFHHWIVTGIDADVRSMDAGEIPEGAVVAQATSDNATYIGPCPADGERREYLFTLFQLDRELDLPEGVETARALEAIDEARLGGEGELRAVLTG